MSDLEALQMTLGRVRRRRWMQRAWRGLWQALLAGGCLWLAALLAYKLFPIPVTVLYVAGWVALAFLPVGVLYGLARKASVAETARWVDAHQHLQERMSTALEMADHEQAGRWRELLLADAAAQARSFELHRALPWALPRAARWALLVLALGAGLGFIPEYRSKAQQKKQQQAEVMKDAGRQLTELARRQLEARPQAIETTQKALEQVKEMGQQLAKVQLSKAQALKELSSLTDKLKEQTRELTQNPALRKLEQAARTTSPQASGNRADLQEKMEELQRQMGKAGSNLDAVENLRREMQNLQKAAAAMEQNSSGGTEEQQRQMAKALGDLAKQAEEMGLSLPNLDDAIEALKASDIDKFTRELSLAQLDLDQMAKMAKALKDLKLQLAQLGKDLPEQLEKGQGFMAVATLQKMIKQLKAGELSAEDMKKLMDEVSRAVKPGSEFGQVGEHLKKAAAQLAQGSKSNASQSLADAADELKRLMDQLGDCESMLASLEGLKMAQMCIGNGLGWKACKSMCTGFKPGGKPGRGVGTWGDDSQWLDDVSDSSGWDNSGVQRPDMEGRGLSDRDANLNPALTPTKVRGQISPGGPMPSVTLKGVSIKGTSRVDYQEAVTAAQSEAESALSQDQVPRAYQGAVRDYFDDLKE